MAGAGLLLLNTKGEVLLARRSQWVNNPYQWGIPGGTVDLGESSREAALREGEEELGPLPDFMPLVRLKLKRRRGERGTRKYTLLVAMFDGPRRWKPNFYHHTLPGGWPENDSWMWVDPRLALRTLVLHHIGMRGLQGLMKWAQRNLTDTPTDENAFSDFFTVGEWEITTKPW